MHDRNRMAMLTVVCGLALASMAQAGESGLPAFEAEVIVDGAHVRSGPGEDYYPTAILRKGAKVTVLGQRMGNWMAVVPPTGSFNWIPARATDEQPDGTGLIVKDGARVYVGSALSDAHHVYEYHITLNKGAQVHIVDRAFLRDGGNVEQWYKILPPKESVRYLLASQLSVPGGQRNEPSRPSTGQQAADPAAPEPLVVRTVGTRVIPPAVPIRRQVSKETTNSVTNAASAQTVWKFTDDPAKPFEQRLASLRTQLAEMRGQKPTAWNTTDARRTLEDLQSKASSVDQQAEVAATLEQVDRWHRLKERYIESRQKSRAAELRDQELATMQRRKEYAAHSLSARYTAVGTLSRAAIRIDNQPTFSIQLPDRTVTHYAVPAPGLNLDPFAGSRVGLIGPVSRRPNLPAPVVTVRQLAPLQ